MSTVLNVENLTQRFGGLLALEAVNKIGRAHV